MDIISSFDELKFDQGETSHIIGVDLVDLDTSSKNAGVDISHKSLVLENLVRHQWECQTQNVLNRAYFES